MSSRQRERLRKLLGAKETLESTLIVGNEVITEEDDDEIDDNPPTRTSGFLYSLDSSSEEDEEGDGENKVVECLSIPEYTTVKNSKQKKQSKLASADSASGEMEFLNQLLAEKEAGDGADATTATTHQPQWWRVLSVKSNLLNLDTAIDERNRRDRQLDQQLQGGDRGQETRKKYQKKLQIAKKYLFCTPQEGWLRPSNRYHQLCELSSEDSSPRDDIGTIKRFTLHTTKEYDRIYDKFLRVQNSGDPNRLVVFLNENSYFPEALLQLAMIFARTGEMDKAMELIKRCLYYFDSLSSEHYRPFQGNCRMEATTPSATVYFSAMFRYMQFSSLLGCPDVSAAIGRVLLSLDPVNDPYHLLLMLDHYLLQSKQYSVIFGFFGMEGNITDLDMKDLSFDRAFPLGCCDCLNGNEESHHPSHSHGVTVSDLPNWCYSLALAAYYDSRDDSKEAPPTGYTAIDTASELLQQAMVRHPYLLPMIVSACQLNSPGLLAITNKPYFREAAQRVDTSSPLYHIGKLYIELQSAQWKKDDIQEWLESCAARVLIFYSSKTSVEGMETQRQYYEASNDHIDIVKYQQAVLEDFQENLNPLPADMNILDPMFADVRMMIDRPQPRRLREQYHEHFRQQDEHQQAVNDFTRQQQDIRRQQEEAVKGNLDPNLPLLQLFLQSLLPWNRIQRYP